MSTNYLPVILSGGPGSGKTTLLNELARRGYACVAEAAREIIREQIATQGDALPWKNRRRYTAIMLKRTIADFDRYREQGGLFFFDRGIPDTLAYARLIRLYLDKSSGNPVPLENSKFSSLPVCFLIQRGSFTVPISSHWR